MLTRQDIVKEATQKQLMASNPQANVFVSASAGSGKTTLLVDRLLRLMLPHYVEGGHVVEGSDPEYILCLTYTRSGAAEMTMKLQKRLGIWVGLDDKALDQCLDRLRVPQAIPENLQEFYQDPAHYRRLCARRLFFRILDLPSGMRMGTIHAFCQSILRMFPVEASINPRFALMEDVDIEDVLERSICDAFCDHEMRTHIEKLARQINWDQFSELMKELHEESRVRSFIRLCAHDPIKMGDILCADLSIDPKCLDLDEKNFKTQLCQDFINAAFKEKVIALYRENGNSQKSSPVITKKLDPLMAWFGQPSTEDVLQGEKLAQEAFLNKDGSVPKRFIQAAEKLSENYGQFCRDMAEKIQDIEHALRARRIALLTCSLFTLLSDVLAHYDQSKSSHMQVEYSDLIRKTLSLLTTPADASWVMYKLDGGIDHILLDEAQDTSPTQWEIVSKLCADFFAGDSGREGNHIDPTLFVVGDGKQSIFAFQGADLASFKKWHQRFKTCSQQASRRWVEPDLSVSFRSTPPILRFVDQVFTQPEAASGVISSGSVLKHQSAHPQKGGRVELWSLIEPQDEEMPDPFSLDIEEKISKDSQQILAEKIAQYLDKLINQEKTLKSEDVLILMPARHEFVVHITRALQERDIWVANLMRTKLIEQLAVQDMLALCNILLFPQDDLTLACVLKSPIASLDDDDLMALAVVSEDGRQVGESLWDCLKRRHQENKKWTYAWQILSDLFSHTDLLTPYRLMMRVLDHFGARTRFARRLGRGALEQLDIVLLQAMTYQNNHPASLQGFVDWFLRSQREVTPQAEGPSGAVRIMTAHGAKGMEAEFVILPYTTRRASKTKNIIWDRQDDQDVPLFVPTQNSSISYTQTLKEEKKARERDERNRLLYVALTRAKSRLLICGWGQDKEKEKKDSWYGQCFEAFKTLQKSLPKDMEVFVEQDEDGPKRYILQKPFTSSQTQSKESAQEKSVTLPDWAGKAPDYQPILALHEEMEPRAFVPSHPDDKVFGALPGARSPLQMAAFEKNKSLSALEKGQLVHALLQFLPTIEPQKRQDVAQSWLQKKVPEDFDYQTLARRVVGVVDIKEIAALFSPLSRAEQRITGRLGDGQIISGQVDRLVELPDRIMVCDYKSGVHVPQDVTKTPRNYLVQMAAYRRVLRDIWPDKKIMCFLVWVEDIRADLIPDEMMDNVA